MVVKIFRLLRAKYMPSGEFVDAKWRECSQFLQGINKVKHLFYKGATFELNNGRNIRFWEDIWCGMVPLRLILPQLYRIGADTNIKVCDCLTINVRRNFGPDERAEWNLLLDMTRGVCLNNERDKVVWALDKTKMFTTRSLYKFMSFQGASNPSLCKIWKVKIPSKIKIFLWQMRLDRLPGGVCLRNRGWKGSDRCCLCGELESSDHIFFRCSLARFVWYIIRRVFGWDRSPSSVSDMWEFWIPRKFKLPRNLGIFICAGLTWATWKARNKMAIEKSFPAPTDVIFCAISLMQKWKVLLKEKDGQLMDEVHSKIVAVISEVEKQEVMRSSDVFEM